MIYVYKHEKYYIANVMLQMLARSTTRGETFGNLLIFHFNIFID